MKKLNLFFLIFIFSILSGCAASQHMKKAQQWELWALNQVQAGQMRPSDFYRGEYNWMATHPNPNEITAYMMNVFSRAIVAAQEFESGRLSLSDFNKFNRDVLTTTHKIAAYAEQKRQAQIQKIYDDFLGSLNALAKTSSANRPQFITCNTTAFDHGHLRTYNTSCW